MRLGLLLLMLSAGTSDEQTALENSLKQAVFSRVDGAMASMKLTSASLR